MVAVKTLIFTLLIPGTVAGWIPYWVAHGDGDLGAYLGPLRWLGVALLIPGILIYARCAWDFTFRGRGTPFPVDPPKLLVAAGLYRFSRNPMYVGVLSVILGESLLYGSWHVLAYAATVGLLFQMFVLFYEEPALTRSFGEAYTAYCAKVPRWI